MSGISSVYPPPPWYYKHFTKDNLEKYKEEKKRKSSLAKGDELNNEAEIKKEVDIEGNTGVDSSKNDNESNETNSPLPFPLNLLEPPTIPEGMESYRGFGNVWQVDDKLLPLEEVGIRQLYKKKEISESTETANSIQVSHQEQIWELKELLKSVLVNFLELVGIMSIAPEKFPDKVEDIRIILINMHHLLNEYRPHQARESLVLLMEDQIQTRKKEIQDLKESNISIQNQIMHLAQQLTGVLTETSANVKNIQDPTQSTTTTPSSTTTSNIIENREQRDLALWELLKKQGITP